MISSSFQLHHRFEYFYTAQDHLYKQLEAYFHCDCVSKIIERVNN